MARVIGPGGIAVPGIATVPLPRADGDDFGAQVGRAAASFGKELAGLGFAYEKLQENRQKAEDQAFLDAADLDLDTGYLTGFQEESSKARSGNESMVDGMRARFDADGQEVLRKLRQDRGFRPSDEALTKYESLKARRQHQYLTRTIAHEHNERIKHIGDQLGVSIESATARAIESGDIRAGIERIDQSIGAHKGLLPDSTLADIRDKAARNLVTQMKQNADPETLEGLLNELPEPRTEDSPDGPPRAPGATSRFSGRVGQAITKAAAEEGVDAGLMDVFARIESGGRPGAVTGSYKGLYQMSEAEFRKYGGGNIFDPEDNARAAARKIKAEGAEFKAKHGRDPSALDLYMVHQQGVAGYDAHLRRPDAPAWQNMAGTGEGRQKGAAWAKRAIWGNVPSDMKARFGSVDNVTSADFVNLWGEKMARFGARGEKLTAAMEDDSMTGAVARALMNDRNEITAAAQKMREKRADAERWSAIADGRLAFDPGNADDKKQLDKAFAAGPVLPALQAGREDAANTVAVLAEKFGAVPESAATTLRGMALNGSPEQKVFALQTAGRILRDRPGALPDSGAGGANKTLVDEASDFNTMVMDLGMSPEQALGRISEMRQPEFQRRREALKKEADTAARDLTIADLTAKHDGWFSSEPGAGGSDRQAAFMLEAYRDSFRYHYARTGDIDVAKGNAAQEMGRAYGVSDVTGNKRLMRLPPEQSYPKIPARANAKPSYDYFNDDLKTTVRELAGKDIPVENIYLEPSPQSFQDIAKGRLPSYNLVWKTEDADGFPILQTAPRPWRPDVKSAQEKAAKAREEAVRADSAANLEARGAYAEDPAYRAGQAVKGYIQQGLPTDSGAADRLRGGNKQFFDMQNLIVQ